MRPNRLAGFTLMDTLIGILMSALLITGIVQLVLTSVSSYRLQLARSYLDESSRFALEVLDSHISQAGYRPEPWTSVESGPGLTSESVDGDPLPGDQLGLQRWSQQNCYDNENPVKDVNDQPVFYLLRARIYVNQSRNLAINCAYGADASQLQTQINAFGLVENVDSMQVLYAEDSDEDAIIDSWVTAQNWQREENVKAIKVALLFSTKQSFAIDNDSQEFLLDEQLSLTDSGQLRKVSAMTFGIKGRLN